MSNRQTLPWFLQDRGSLACTYIAQRMRKEKRIMSSKVRIVLLVAVVLFAISAAGCDGIPDPAEVNARVIENNATVKQAMSHVTGGE